MAAQRWYDAVADPEVSIRRVDTLRDGWPSLLWVLVEVRSHRGSGDPSWYQLLLGADSEEPVELPPASRLGAMPSPRGSAWLFDALADEELALDFARVVDPEGTFAAVRALPGDHMNTSLVLDESYLLKVFRHVYNGPNPDVEVTEELGRIGYQGISAPVDVWRRGSTDLAVLRRLERTRGTGRDLAVDSLRELVNSRLAPRDGKLDFAQEAEDLGAEVASMHVALAEAFGTQAADGAEIARDMVAQLHRVTEGQLDTARIESNYERLSTAEDLGAAIRVHGALRLGKCLRIRRSWLLVDFEGESGRSPQERRRPSSPLRDVAGMTRSFHRVASEALGEVEVPDEELRVLADAWAERNLNAFLSGYASVDEVHRLLPGTRASRDALLSVFELDRAVYEVAHDLSHRPALADRPTQAVERLLADDGTEPADAEVDADLQRPFPTDDPGSR
ncbi:MAG: maltokinase N-terminal cap-like domain-containing protein [Microthrixaceae bacterium]